MQSCCAHSDEVTPVIRPYDRCQAYICHTVQAPGSIGMPGRRSVTPGIRALCPVSQLMVSIKIILCSFWIYLASSAALCDGWQPSQSLKAAALFKSQQKQNNGEIHVSRASGRPCSRTTTVLIVPAHSIRQLHISPLLGPEHCGVSVWAPSLIHQIRCAQFASPVRGRWPTLRLSRSWRHFESLDAHNRRD